jgi:hypothetical protein
MNLQSDETEIRRHALAVGIWENEGGAPGPIPWIITTAVGSKSTHHTTCSRIPVAIGRHSMTDLKRSGATTSLSLHNVERRSDQDRLSAPSSKNLDINEGRS